MLKFYKDLAKIRDIEKKQLFYNVTDVDVILLSLQRVAKSSNCMRPLPLLSVM